VALTAGGRLGHFEILAPLGAGGMGVVYRGRDTRLGRDVALKVLPEAFARDSGRLARFEREARVLATLSHPGIAAIYGLEPGEDGPVLVMELVEGEVLDKRLARGPVPVRQALELARQMAAALESAHAKGIIHRDLKPSNIKVTPEGQVKLLDFGLAKALAPADDETRMSESAEGSTTTGVVVGTAPYMSPEQARGEALDRRTDVWSFRCVVYEMLAGGRAFPGHTAEAVAAVLEREPVWPALPGETPAKVVDLLRRCLQKDRNRRLHDIADARIELEEARASFACSLTWEGREIGLVEGENVIGRDESCAVRIEAPRVSRRHACIRVCGPEASIEDLGSKNGTFLRGRQLAGAADLEDGDEIGIGGARFTFRAAYGSGSTVTG